MRQNLFIQFLNIWFEIIHPRTLCSFLIRPETSGKIDYDLLFDVILTDTHTCIKGFTLVIKILPNSFILVRLALQLNLWSDIFEENLVSRPSAKEMWWCLFDYDFTIAKKYTSILIKTITTLSIPKWWSRRNTLACLINIDYIKLKEILADEAFQIFGS